MWWPTADALCQLHDDLIAATGGAPGLRNRAALESALGRPLAGFGGRALYPDLVARAGALADALIRNHAFVDGNKRTAMAAALSVLDQAGFVLQADGTQIEETAVRVAERQMDLASFTRWLRTHLVRLD